MSINPAIRLILLLSVILVQFFTAVIYLNSLAGKNVELTRIRRNISSQIAERGNYRDQATRQLNEELVNLSRTEVISRVQNNETVKLKDLTPPPTETPKNDIPKADSEPRTVISR